MNKNLELKVLSQIRNNQQGYQALISFYLANKDKLFDDIHLELRQWFSANMSAAFGAVLDLLAGNINNIHFDYIENDIEAILSKNNFLSYYGKQRREDTFHTTIKYQKLKPTDGKYFKRYVIEELIGRTELPNMSNALKEKMVEAIHEIFDNAQIHSETNFIYTCGQFYPKKNLIEFTIVDTGIGFKEKIERRFGVKNLSATQAIEWAVQDKHTTKELISGGIGLAVLREFIGRNNGCMQIVSNRGFYEFKKMQGETHSFNGAFPGTIVNLQFRTDDNNNYSLISEIDIDNIF